ncbi:uncharacterized protein LOC122081771 [Macadamia integrifolia]|uniref:uncharacterized protein LOC122081771 n=1 Tax=Macadamia integrifolia TaxID=60698 RepID=UPI001C4FC1F4|nr:uncharacterized protein LOC122081771 [Macadamia integrifolia]
MVSLHFQLSQERNERRLAEYHLKHSSSQSQFFCSPEKMKEPDAVDYGMPVQEQKVSRQMFQHVVGKLTKEVPSKGLWNCPNQLSEDMVRCMRNIFHIAGGFFCCIIQFICI